MTEKRFYYNTFYHADDMSRVLEYEIIDRQSYPNYPNHDEKEDIPNWFIYIGENDSGWQDMLVDLLNELNDEKEKLKRKRDYYKKLRIHLNGLIGEDVDVTELNYQLEKENEELKKENEALKDTIEALTETISHFDMEEMI